MAQKVSFFSQRPSPQNNGLNGAADLDAALVPFKCRRSSCAHGLGLTDGNELYLDGVIIGRNTLLMCLHYECGHENQWRPQQTGTVVRRDMVRQKGVVKYFKAQPSPASRYPSLKPVPCPHCEARVGFTDGTRFYAAELVIPHRVEYECLYCGERATWRPILKPCPC